MAKVIIGIHGLANKPEEDVLRDWWKKSIEEGLNINCNYKKQVNFTMVHWAKYLYKHQQHTDRAFSFDNLYNKEPYKPAAKNALKEFEASALDDLKAGSIEVIGGIFGALKGSAVWNKLTEKVINKAARDLSFYYDEKRKIKNENGKLERARLVLQRILRTAIKQHKDDEIMLIAHSMGSIIAYDVVRNIGRNPDADEKNLTVPHFVTIGSPLGISKVKENIIAERDYDKAKKDRLRTPTIVTGDWINYADAKDIVAVDSRLSDDYGENKHGVRVRDDMVANDYVRPSDKNKHNHHKSYGYLRTPELSRHILKFLKA